jgi:hypothetical protein
MKSFLTPGGIAFVVLINFGVITSCDSGSKAADANTTATATLKDVDTSAIASIGAGPMATATDYVTDSVSAFSFTKGLGKSRDFFKALYGSAFVWKDSPLADGRDRLLGTAKNGMGNIELIGPENDLTQVLVKLAVTDDNSVTMGMFIFDLTKTVEPRATGWLKSHLLSGGTKTFGDTKVSVTTVEVNEGGIVTISFEKM